ncbi:MAG TPA: hypothetical protein PK110_09990 [Niabella sp.]|jgi:hypothetical protein|nr:hypothetical protein [Chitinophagaceae bacterium]HRN47746.1 hypothetical protein [Niabella sp.]HRO85140.1 hypothetical protein [Niabella sp.]
MWWVAAQKTGASAYNLMDFMGFGAYETAWTWLQKLRSAKVRIITSKKTLYVLPKNSASP